MTRQLKRTNKISLGILYFLNIVFVLASYLISYFNEKKMGMRRQMVYFNREWESNYPIPLFKNIIIVFLILLIVFAIYKLINFIKLKYNQGTVTSIYVSILAIFTLYFVLTSNKTLNRAYYSIVLALFIANIFSLLLMTILRWENVEK